MSSRIRRWIEERWPLSALIRLGFEEEIPGGATYAYVFGSATLITFIMQIVTGICQLRYYVPTLDHAYDSLNYLRTEVPFGWLIHGLHYRDAGRGDLFNGSVSWTQACQARWTFPRRAESRSFGH